MALHNLTKTFLENNAEADRLNKQIAQLTAKRSSLNCSWVDLVVKPLAKKLKRYVPGYRMEVLGPFGLCHETSISFYKNGVPEEKLWDKKGSVKSITLVPESGNGMFRIVDYRKDKGTYPKDSIGAINGMNHPRILVDPNTWTLKDLIKFIR